jgi:hypothetical protein
MDFLKTDWFPDLTNAQISTLHRYGGNVMDVYTHINTFFDAHAINRINRVCVTLNCQNPWPVVLGPLFDASGCDEERAALFLGNLFCRVAINRPEVWMSAPYPIFRQRRDPHKWAPRHYFFAPDFLGKPRQRRS